MGTEAALEAFINENPELGGEGIEVLADHFFPILFLNNIHPLSASSTGLFS